MKALATFALLLGIAACGGKNKGPAPAAGGEGDDPATPFNDGAVKAALSATAGVSECGAEPSTTMGAHLAAQREMLKGGDPSAKTGESFMCRAQASDQWECEWSVQALPDEPAAADPCAGAPAPVEGEEGGEEDPCGGECCSSYIVMFTVSNGGAIAPGSIHCVAPG